MTLRALVGVDWATDANGLVTRQAFCSCGREYTQLQLSAAYLALCKPGVLAALDRQCPGGWVPINCPPCEHVQLGIDARASVEAEKADARQARRRHDAEAIRYALEERAGMAAP